MKIEFFIANPNNLLQVSGSFCLPSGDLWGDEHSVVLGWLRCFLGFSLLVC